jgi:uncharacterized protein YcfJ
MKSLSMYGMRMWRTELNICMDIAVSRRRRSWDEQMPETLLGRLEALALGERVGHDPRASAAMVLPELG